MKVISTLLCIALVGISSAEPDPGLGDILSGITRPISNVVNNFLGVGKDNPIDKEKEGKIKETQEKINEEERNLKEAQEKLEKASLLEKLFGKGQIVIEKIKERIDSLKQELEKLQSSR